SIQEGSDRDFSSVDDLFERAKTLFYKKYESGRGIRLLGVAAQNLEDSSAPRQADLFDFGEEKKRKVEEAILKQLEKNPAIKITKARMMRD
ncbi:MAG: DNA polymerase IV, partial [Treponema sp.]|nr:DNA polymerase IV [Treponema sp.]